MRESGSGRGTGEYDLGYSQKKPQFCGYNDVFGSKKKVMVTTWWQIIKEV